ncbi:MAG: hypothetical protein SPL55_06185, partial [Prevotella sp.]|nr:hypothetical protein [Prevotella sp.]
IFMAALKSAAKILVIYEDPLYQFFTFTKPHRLCFRNINVAVAFWRDEEDFDDGMDSGGLLAD